jgi:conjugative transfer signal peptidase TraF
MAKGYQNRKKAIVWTAIGIAIAVLANVIHPDYQIRFNPSVSAPRGFYLFAPAKDIRIGSAVFVQLPTAIAGFAAARDYLPLGVPILKRVGAVSGQHVCLREGTILIDRKFAAWLQTVDGHGRPMPHWVGCRVLDDDELFLLSTSSPASFDSRYFGPVSRSSVIARATPLWTW